MSYAMISSETIYNGKIFNLRIDQVRTPDGTVRQLDVIEHGGAVAFLPVDSENMAWLVRQYRHAAGGSILEIPAGTLEPGEDPAACVVRECREEIGMHPGKITPLGECFLAPGYSTEKIWLFLVQDLTPSPLPPDEDENILVETYSLDSLPELISNGSIIDAKTITALYLAGLPGKRDNTPQTG